MNTYENRFRMILFLLIGYKIQRICGDENNPAFLNDPAFLRTISQFLETLSTDQIQNLYNTSRVLRDATDSTDDRTAPDYVSWWNSLNTAIDDFVREFEWQHQASKLRVDRRLKTIDWPLTSNFDDCFSERYLLDFSFQRDGQVDRVHSSVLVSIPDLSFLYDKGKELMVYDKEKYMFEKVFPLMYQSWKYEKHLPNFYASAESGTLIIENLNNGLRIVRNGLMDSVEECKVVFKALAEFHALSLAQLDEVVYSNLNAFSPVSEWVKNTVMGHNAIETLTKRIKRTIRLFSPSQQDEIRNVTRNLDSVIESAFTAGSGDAFTVVLQGSPHSKNIFFEIDEQTSRLTRCKFFNFRFSHTGSPVLDLMTYLLSSVEFKLFAEKGDSLFEFYLEELHKSLVEFEHSREYNLTMLQADLRRYKPFFIYMLVSSVPMQWASDYVSSKNVDQLIPGAMDVIQSEKYALFSRNWMNTLFTW